ncbi:hypothetical protein CRUP_007490 [Coryphaenoides rupestris]|nr:hypothetical protein CRUP_007490 [Coryphaenoides rupestris]
MRGGNRAPCQGATLFHQQGGTGGQKRVRGPEETDQRADFVIGMMMMMMRIRMNMRMRRMIRTAKGYATVHCTASAASATAAFLSDFTDARFMRQGALGKDRVWLASMLEAVKVSPLIEKVSDHKDFKKLLRTRTNVLVLYTKTGTSGDHQLKLLSDVAQTVKGQGTVAWVNCGDGSFHTEYNRPATFKSMVAFLKDPSGPPLWEEVPEAKDIVHIETEKGKFLHHYENYGATAKDIADWLKNPQPPQPKTPEVPWSESESPVFHLTDATLDSFLEEHPSALSPGVLAAMDTTVHKAAGERFKISGFPTVKYFEKGEDMYTLPQLRSKDKIIEFMYNPQAPPPPEQSWEDKPSSVSHLGTEDFREALKKKKHALSAVPHFTTAADVFKEDRKIAYAAVDCTKGQNHELCKQEGVEGYPTFNYYNYGKFAEKYNGDRGEAGFLGFMRSLRGRDQEKISKKREEL